MPVEADKELTLPFGDLPQPMPLQMSASQPRKRKPSQVKQLIDGCDWKTYETSVFSLLCEAIEQYKQQYADEKVYQISIWTDPQVQISAINFETKEHAEEQNAALAPGFRNARGYNDNPAGFKYCRFLERKHPEIVAIDGLSYFYHTHRYAADARISTSLRRVIKRVREQNILSGVPREEEAWIGVNSPRDWYDHVTKI